MDYYFDTEFSDREARGSTPAVDLISIGIVSGDGRELYAETAPGLAYDPDLCSDWVKANVLTRLKGGDAIMPVVTIAQKIRELVKDDPNPVFWGYFASYDWVLFCQLFGGMLKVPHPIPMFVRDTKQFAIELGDPPFRSDATYDHNALNDARWTREYHRFLKAYEAKKYSKEIKPC